MAGSKEHTPWDKLHDQVTRLESRQAVTEAHVDGLKIGHAAQRTTLDAVLHGIQRMQKGLGDLERQHTEDKKELAGSLKELDVLARSGVEKADRNGKAFESYAARFDAHVGAVEGSLNEFVNMVRDMGVGFSATRRMGSWVAGKKAKIAAFIISASGLVGLSEVARRYLGN